MGKRRIRNLFASGERDVTGLDPSAEKRQEAEEMYQIQTVENIQDISSESFDVLIISTSPEAHGDYIRYALANKKHFFVEHPANDDGYREILENKDKTIKAPSCTFLFNPAVKMMKQVLKNGKIGKVLAFQYHMGQYLPDWHSFENYQKVYFSKKETGACREMFAFELIWLSSIMDSRVKEATGSLVKLSNLDMEADDTLTATVQYENGIRGALLIDVISRKPYRTLRILGSEGVLEWERFDYTIKVFNVTSKTTEVLQVPKGRPEKGYVNEEEMYVEEINAFLDALRGRASFPYTFKENLTNLNAYKQLENH